MPEIMLISYVGVAANIGIGGNATLSESNYALISKIGHFLMVLILVCYWGLATSFNGKFSAQEKLTYLLMRMKRE